MISLIVVALVGIGFTRLTMLALELRDNYDEAAGEEPVDIGRKRLEVHNKMVALAKPEHIVVKGENQFEVPAESSEDAYTSVLQTTEKLQESLSSLFWSTDKQPVTEEVPRQDIERQDANETQPTDVCTICFEKAKNAVLLGCGHGLCYSCSIDVCVTSGHCPFCRSDIAQIVTIAIGNSTKDSSGNTIFPIIGPK